MLIRRRRLPRHAISRETLPSIISYATLIALILGVSIGVAPPPRASAVTIGFDLGAASTYAILAGTALTANGSNSLSPRDSGRTDVGVFPSSTMTATELALQGHGAINLGNAAAGQAQADAQLVFDQLRSAAPVTYINGELGGTRLFPGIYTPNVTAAAITMTTSFTLDGGGNPDAVWVFTTEAAASTAAGITMNLVNGAQAANVYWAIGAAFSTGASATVAGHFLAASSISLGAATTINGQLIGLKDAPVTIGDGMTLTNDASVGPQTTVWVDQTIAAMYVGTPYLDGLSVATRDGDAFDPATDVLFEVSAGTLPPGVALDAGVGTLSGTPTLAGYFTFTVSATVVGCTPATETFSIMVSGGSHSSLELGMAGSYAVLGSSNVTNVGTTSLSGDAGTNVGVEVGPVVTGTQFSGAQRTDVGNGAVTRARSDLYDAMTYAQGMTAQAIPAEIGGLTLTAGTYAGAAALGFTGDLVLNADNDPTAAFIIRTPAALVSAASARVLLVNGAQACNVFWVVGAAVTLGATNTFAGRIMSTQGITVGAGTTVQGQLLTHNEAVTLSNNVITNSGCLANTSLSIDGGATATVFSTTPTISGLSNAVEGSTVTVTVAGQALSTFVTNTGTWAVLPSTLVEDTHVVSVVVDNLFRGSALASQAMTIDTVGPTVLIIGGANSTTAERTPTIRGTSNAIGRTVSVVVSGETLSGAVGADGVWSVVGGSLANGSYVISASVTATDGRTANAAQTLTVVFPYSPQNDTISHRVERGSDTDVQILGSGFKPGDSVEVWLHSTPSLFGTFVANNEGDVAVQQPLDAATPVGVHHFVLVGASSGTTGYSQEIVVFAAVITAPVIPAPVIPTPPTSASEAPVAPALLSSTGVKNGFGWLAAAMILVGAATLLSPVAPRRKHRTTRAAAHGR
jgi:hypothetical protein